MTYSTYQVEPLRHQAMLQGLSNKELAHRAGLVPTTVARALRGLPVHRRTIRRLADALRIPMDDLIMEGAA